MLCFDCNSNSNFIIWVEVDGDKRINLFPQQSSRKKLRLFCHEMRNLFGPTDRGLKMWPQVVLSMLKGYKNEVSSVIHIFNVALRKKRDYGMLILP